MKRIFLLATCWFALMANAQDMPMVAGVQFGWQYGKCKKVLDKKYNNGVKSYQPDAKTLLYPNINFADIDWDFVSFTFQSSNKKNILSQIFFSKRYRASEKTLADVTKTKLIDSYNKKYTFRRYYEPEDGSFLVIAGSDPLEPEKPLFSIGMMLEDGDYLLIIKYGPIEFAHPEDEI